MTAQTRPRPIALSTAIWLIVALVGWTMIAWLGVRLYSASPPNAGFDLELSIRAGRAVAAGASPYDPALVAGTAPGATSLFFSYPPVVAQAFALVGWAPSGLIFLAWSIGAVAAMLAVGERIRRAIRDAAPARGVALTTLAGASLTFPFTIAVLFGNVDAFFPALYGLALVAAMAPSRSTSIAGGIAIAVAAVAKLYPAGLGLWFAVRAAREQRSWMPVAAAVVTAGLFLLISLAIGGLNPWRDYISAVGAASRAELLDPKNIAPAALLARLVGGGSDVARLIQIFVSAAAVVTIAWTAWKRPDPVESLAIAAAATFVLLPVTWVHYPAAMIPFGVAALLRADGPAATTTRVLMSGAIVVAGASLFWLPLLWVAVGLAIAGVRASATQAVGR